MSSHTPRQSKRTSGLVGPGGLKCPCCAPRSNKNNGNARSLLKRQLKKQERRTGLEDMAQQLEAASTHITKQEEFSLHSAYLAAIRRPWWRSGPMFDNAGATMTEAMQHLLINNDGSSIWDAVREVDESAARDAEAYERDERDERDDDDGYEYEILADREYEHNRKWAGVWSAAAPMTNNPDLTRWELRDMYGDAVVSLQWTGEEYLAYQANRYTRRGMHDPVPMAFDHTFTPQQVMATITMLLRMEEADNNQYD